MTRRELITSNEYIEVNVDNTIISHSTIRFMRMEMAKFIIEFRDELLELEWISLKKQLPPANIEVEWYDAMFDKITVFAMRDPSQHDGDFTHWKPASGRPKEFDEIFANKKPDPSLIYFGYPFIKCPKCNSRQPSAYLSITGKKYCIGCGELLKGNRIP